MTDEAPTGRGQIAASRTSGGSASAPPAVRLAGQPRLDEIGRALGLVRRRLEPIAGLPERTTAPLAALLQCPTCGHERWTATGCAVCALLGPGR